MIQNKEQFRVYFEEEIKTIYEEDIKKSVDSKKKMIFFIPFVITAVFILSSMWVFILPLLSFVVVIGIITMNARIKKGKESVIKGLLKSSFQGIVAKEEALKKIIPAVLPSFRYSSEYAIKEEEFLDYPFIQADIINRYHSEDTIVGSLGNTEVRISELRIRNDRNKGFRDIFNGVITEINLGLDPDFDMAITKKEFRKQFNDTTITRKTLPRIMMEAAEKVDWFEAQKGHEERELEKISLNNVQLDDKYVILTSDPVKANKLIEPRIINNFNMLNKKKGWKISLGFHKGKLMILTEKENNLFDIFSDGNFDSNVIWDDIIEMIETIKYVEKLGFDYKKIRRK